MDSITITDKTEAHDTITAQFPDAPTEVMELIDDLIDQINQTRGGTEWYSPGLNLTVHLDATAATHEMH